MPSDEAEGLWASLWRQLSYLSRHTETHLGGNHLLENGAALAMAGACFAGDAADGWLRQGVGILSQELDEQILEDGVHYERSSMYQARILWLLEALQATQHQEIVGLVGPRIESVRLALGNLCHPDGGIALLNDSALGVVRVPDDLSAGRRHGAFELPASGYYGYRDGDGTYLVYDAGALGPDHIPGHAHGDTFSFELSCGGRRVFVDSGVFDYEETRMRAFCRSTAAHNTVEIEGCDQAEFWGTFRVARRGRPRDVRREVTSDGFVVDGWYDGYRRLRGMPVHRRRMTWQARGVLVLEDEITAGRNVDAVARLHVHPDWRISLVDAQCAEIGTADRTIVVRYAGDGTLDLGTYRYCPEFGSSIEAPCLAFRMRGSALSLRTAITLGTR
jgi:uncharacterized heparinase superfamily protein